jgi:stage V sporulation protein SpoVS
MQLWTRVAAVDPSETDAVRSARPPKVVRVGKATQAAALASTIERFVSDGTPVTVSCVQSAAVYVALNALSLARLSLVMSEGKDLTLTAELRQIEWQRTAAQAETSSGSGEGVGGAAGAAERPEVRAGWGEGGQAGGYDAWGIGGW